MTEQNKPVKKSEVFKFQFKASFPQEQRAKEFQEIKAKHPTRIPIIVEQNKAFSPLPELDHNKFLIPDDFDFSQCVTVIRKRLQLQPHEAIFILFESGKLYSQDKKIKLIYEKEKDKDGFLYLIYSKENVTGN